MKDAFYLVLEIISNMSAFMCTLKYKNKVVRVIAECIYCVLIFAFPILGISIFLMILGGNPEVNMWEVVQCIGYIVGVSCIYFILTNGNDKKKIEDYLLTVSLSLQSYIDDEQRKKKQKKKIILDILIFIVMFIFFLLESLSLMNLLCEDTYITGWISFVAAMCLSYVLFVYGKRDEKTIEQRKTTIGIGITIIWFFLVSVRINYYWENINQIGLADMMILFFSVLFTIPTIWGWVRTIPTKIMYPYKEKVAKRKDEIIESYTILKNECNKSRIQFINDVKEILYIIKCKWKKTEKRKKNKIILKAIGIFICTILLFVMAMVVARGLNQFIPFVLRAMKEWFNSLSEGIQTIISQIIFTALFGSLMIDAIIKIPSLYNTKTNWIEKTKYILGVIILEVLLGTMTLAIWFGL